MRTTPQNDGYAVDHLDASTLIDGLLSPHAGGDTRTQDAGDAAAPLPFPAPLSHSIFLTEPFSASSFLLSRKHMSLDDLRSELRSYLAVLRSELVAIINSDYEDFVSLGGARLLGPGHSSTFNNKTSGGKGAGPEEEGTLGLRMRGPLERCGAEVAEAREELAALQAKLRTAMDRRDAIRERKAQCRKLLGVNEQIGKVEEMLLIQHPTVDENITAGKQDGKSLSVQTNGLLKPNPAVTGSRKVSPAHKKLDRYGACWRF